jgi:hypothetical protein
VILDFLKFCALCALIFFIGRSVVGSIESLADWLIRRFFPGAK